MYNFAQREKECDPRIVKVHLGLHLGQHLRRGTGARGVGVHTRHDALQHALDSFLSVGICAGNSLGTHIYQHLVLVHLQFKYTC